MTDDTHQTNTASKAHTPISLRVMQGIWSRRTVLVRTVHAVGRTLGWLYDRFPLPQRVKDIVTELTYQSIEHFIVQSNSYQNWLQRRNGLTRLHQLFRLNQEEEAAPSVHAPGDAEWDHVKPHNAPASAKLAVIVPVYKGYHETLRCLYQLLVSTNDTRFQLTVINDASPDESLCQILRKLSVRFHFNLIEQSQNQGFVRTVNNGMQQHEDCDVVLLNADTEVYDGWLDRMIETLHYRDDIASVTPFSNNAELCSYPISFKSNQTPLEIGSSEIDKLAATMPLDAPELPTAVGFCMAIKRRALDEIGLFDDALFGKGYGEENDWCLRASANGWRHVMATNVFVRHHGSVSFEAQKRRELNRSLKKLNKKHPHYRKLVRSFRYEDPLLHYRQQLDLARIQCQLTDRTILMISHLAGGGTERHILDLSRWLEQEGISILRLSPDPERLSHVQLWHPAAPNTPNLSFHIDQDQHALQNALMRLGVSHIHLHHLIGFPTSMPLWILATAKALNCEFDATIHDYYLACPSINLLTDGDSFTENPTLNASQDWARQNPSAAGRMPIWQWREQHRQLLNQARRIFAPSNDAAIRMQHFFPELDLHVRPHPEETLHITPANRTHRPNEPIEIAIIGRLVAHKGENILLQLAQDAAVRELPVVFHVFGAADQVSALRKTGQVILHGAYEEGEIGNLLQTHRCHAMLLPSVWPETYSYTLSIALQHKLFPICFDLGAPAERLRAIDWGLILPKESMQQPQVINDALMALNIGEATESSFMTDYREQYPSMLHDYYQLNLDESVNQSATSQSSG